MNTNSNTYTIIYSTILVVVVAGVLALVSSLLKPRQQDNIALEKMQTILRAANLGADANEQADKTAYIKDLYQQHITNSYILNYKGEVIDGEAFNVDLKAQANIIKKIDAAKDEASAEALKASLKLPVFVCTTDNQTLNIFPCYGAGLWGAIWGYISVEDDFATIHGAIFDHESETPGLGAEIAHEKFYGKFAGKRLEKDGAFKSIAIVKGGGQADNVNGVDAISGATITCKALETTIDSWFKEYLPYFNIKKEAVDAGNSPCGDGCCTDSTCTDGTCAGHDADSLNIESTNK
ncbi:MAG: NADH:ubiquinone reductase (Na(+)-transporting) subunit C [Bacteroidales bacterium]|nr:NADH:ubiquinone reductase (Na(+)-transporting) subunit C [Bacteroidales bacterium]MDD4670270.1 NADH:ubiquinone reductase (Na(+)-transporting) subunit C [Bacteroidales bacterium]